MKIPLRIAIAGLGTVGGGVLKALRARGDELAERAERRLDIIAVSARDKNKARASDISGFKWIDDPVALARADADVVVELIGGEEGVARELVEASLLAGKHVVTANKALLAHHGAHLAKLAEDRGLALKFEAAAAGGIPIVKALRESLIVHGVNSVRGILNGTCNYILTNMEKTERSFPDVLMEAQALGYAEADPTLDVGGGDTAHKLAILSCLAFGTAPNLEHMQIEGIQHIKPDDIGYARELGYRIKLLGIARRIGGGIDQRVQPAMVRAGTPLADVDAAFNAVSVNAGEAGPFFFEGRGAGEGPRHRPSLRILSILRSVPSSPLSASLPIRWRHWFPRRRRPHHQRIICASRCSTSPAFWPRSPGVSRTSRSPSKACCSAQEARASRYRSS